jgi:hypothetical protein
LKGIIISMKVLRTRLLGAGWYGMCAIIVMAASSLKRDTADDIRAASAETLRAGSGS